MVFDAYARYYDLLYKDKDYEAEARYIAGMIRQYHPQATSILDLGCGTGKHAEYLARMGFVVHGVDMSETMLACAQQRKLSLPPEIAARLAFSHGDVRLVRTGQAYDVVISLFHVMSYQTANADLQAAMQTAAAHLHAGGLFLFDFWYGPAVLTQKPEVRVRRLEDDAIKVMRIAEPVMHANENVIDVNYTIFIEGRADGDVRQVHETHRMRYIFMPELEYLCAGRFASLHCSAWMSDRAPGIDDWAAMAILERCP